jgi:hypothetical protein
MRQAAAFVIKDAPEKGALKKDTPAEQFQAAGTEYSEARFFDVLAREQACAACRICLR